MNTELYTNTKAIEIIKRINDHIHGDDKILQSLKKIINDNKSLDPYYYCDIALIKKINDYIKLYENLKNTNDEECCICLDKCQFIDRSYFMCKHFVCNICYNTSDFTSNDARCPICRTIIKKFIFSDKYAIICTGIPTKLYTFENGGYKTICISYIPEFEDEKSTIFANITYHDDNVIRFDFLHKVYKLLNSGYSVILQKHTEVKRWMNEVMMKALVHDKRLIYE